MAPATPLLSLHPRVLPHFRSTCKLPLFALKPVLYPLVLHLGRPLLDLNQGLHPLAPQLGLLLLAPRG